MANSITHLNGRPATAEHLAPLAFAGYAHFTAMQVRAHCVRGLDLHLARLRSASDELFGQHLPDAQVSQYVRTALDAAAPDVSLTCFLTSRPGEFAPGGAAVDLDVLIKVTDPAEAPTGPLALDVAHHERHLPHIKHVGEIAKTRYLRAANSRGFDDAAFEDRSGRLSEATIWNLAFWDGESVIWPKADLLTGVTMQILTRQLRVRGIPQRTCEIRRSELTDQLAAVVMNSWTPAIPLARIGDHLLAQEPAFARLLHDAYADETAIRP